MTLAQKRLIRRLNTNPNLLRLQIKGCMARIDGIKWSLDWHLDNGGSLLDDYYMRLTGDIAREDRRIIELNRKLALTEQ